MGAGQIGGIATMLDIDFNNAAGFQGVPAKVTEGQFIVHYLSHAMLFCVGALIEAHVVITPAICVFGERYKFKVFGGTHRFLENTGTDRLVHHLCIHKGYNHTLRFQECSTDNLALLVLNQQFSFHHREPSTEYIVNRVRYGVVSDLDKRIGDPTCRFYGWGSRRNGYLIPLLIRLYRMDVSILPTDRCYKMWNNKNKYLCIQQPKCKSEKHGALCPVSYLFTSPSTHIMYICHMSCIYCKVEVARQYYETISCCVSCKYFLCSLYKDDLGTVLVCSGYVQGIMTSRLIDRPCGVGFLDLSHYNKFLTCGVDDSRDVIDHEDLVSFDFNTEHTLPTPSLLTTIHNTTIEVTTETKP